MTFLKSRKREKVGTHLLDYSKITINPSKRLTRAICCRHTPYACRRGASQRHAAPRAVANRRHGPAHHLAGHTIATSDPEFERRPSILQLDVLFVEHGTAFAKSAAGAVQDAVLNQPFGLDDGKRARARKTDCGSRHTEFRLACSTLIRRCATMLRMYLPKRMARSPSPTKNARPWLI